MIAIDFFSGCGGASFGLQQSGFEIVLGLDSDHDAAGSYQANFPEATFIEKDIRSVSIDDVAKYIEGNSRPLLFTACAPCQPFSQQNKNKNSNEDGRTMLLSETHRFIEALRPEFILIENVPGMQKIDTTQEGPFSKFIELLESLDYNYTCFIAKAENYGVPQRRKRLVLLASSLGPINTPEPTHGDNLQPFTTVWDYIGEYAPISAGETHSTDQLHRAGVLTPLNLERIQHTPEGGDRRNWPAHLVNECHKNYTGHTDTYGRMSWGRPAPTLTTKCNSYSNGRFGHPDINQNRAISVREASRLQTFPADYVFHGSFNSIAKQIGNAVPCKLARQFGLHFIEHYQQVVQEELNIG